MILNIPPIDPVTTINDFQSNYVNISTLLQQGTGVPPGVKLLSPQDQPILNLELPADLRDAITAFQNSNPQAASLTAVKYMRTTNGNPDLVVEDDTPLPDQNNLVTFSHTVSTISVNSVNIVSHQIVATLAPVQTPFPGPVQSPPPPPGPVAAE
jgi:hypothetical protein